MVVLAARRAWRAEFAALWRPLDGRRAANGSVLNLTLAARPVAVQRLHRVVAVRVA